jgi:tetratricopeptide (TPR) repeat protein
MVRKLLLCTAALFAPGTSRAEWHEASSRHFIVYADDAPDRIKAYTTRLEKYDKAMRVMRGIPEDRRGEAARVTVFQLKNVSDIQKLYGGRGNVGGFYFTRSSGSVAFVPRNSGSTGAPWETKAERILLHEYAHHFMYADWPSSIFPRWFSEGFAEYHSTALFNSDGSVTFGAPPTDRAWGVADINAMPLARMLDPALGKLDRRETYALYSRGWALTHYLTQDTDHRKLLGAYLQAINQGRSSDDAAKVFGDVRALDFKLISYVKRPRFGSQQVPADKLEIGAVTVRKLTPGEAATMPARIRSQRGVDDVLANQVVVQARAAAAAYPDDAAAQNVLAEAEYDAKQYAAAEAAASRALAANPKSLHALLYKGMALQAAAEAAKITGTSQWNAIRQWYILANRVAVEDPEPLVRFYRSFKPAGQVPSASAKQGMLYAAALAPYDLDLKIEAARIYMQQHNPAEARRAIEPVAFSPHGGEGAIRMREVIATLDKDGAKPALAQLDKVIREAEAEAKKDGGKKTEGDE